MVPNAILMANLAVVISQTVGVLANLPACHSDSFPDVSPVSLLQTRIGLSLDNRALVQSLDEHASTLAAQPHAKINYMPEQKILVCTCAKCGSTSLYSFLFEEAFGEPWKWRNRWPQDPGWDWDGRLFGWDGRLVDHSSVNVSELFQDPATFSYALYRDPKKRFISGWKDKVACNGEHWGMSEPADAAWFTHHLLELVGEGNTTSCLSFAHYVELRSVIHENGNESKLNEHFLPQHLNCFMDRPVDTWSQVAQISDRDAAWRLAERFDDYSRPSFPRLHPTTNSTGLSVSELLDGKMNAITKEEYLGLSLPPPTSARAYTAY